MSTINPDNTRLFRCGGGADVRDSIANLYGAENCSELCSIGMTYGGLGDWWYNLPSYSGYHDPHYLKCKDEPRSFPLNGLRIQHASQMNTMNIDPLIPQMNITDSVACMGRF